MRKGLLIIGLVTGYSLLETGLLLSTLRDGVSPSRWSIVIYAAQLVIIPGMAALFSRILHGRARWIGSIERAVAILATLVFSLTLLGLLCWLIDWATSVAFRPMAALLVPVVATIALVVTVIRKGWVRTMA